MPAALPPAPHRAPLRRPRRPSPAARAAAALLFAACAWPALAQYKIVAPDGSVTYTDRPPPPSGARVTELGRRPDAAPASGAPVLPAALARVAERFPVTLYASDDCAPCDRGRQMLQQRGIPYREVRVISNEDVAALEQRTGARTVPSLTVGAQVVRGFSEVDWSAYLDAAGYPRESQLPPGWAPPPPAPLVARAPQPVAPTPAPAEPGVAEPPPPPPPGTIRF